MSDVMEILSKLRSPEWIAIDDKEPPSNQALLCYIPGTDPSENTYEYSLKLCKRGCPPGTGLEWDDRITHWMPLPEPPGDTKEDNLDPVFKFEKSLEEYYAEISHWEALRVDAEMLGHPMFIADLPPNEIYIVGPVDETTGKREIARITHLTPP